MSQGVISKKYLIDMANAIRVMLDTSATYTPAQMVAAIQSITGDYSGTIVKSADTGSGLITEATLQDICDALRSKLGDDTLTFTPAQIADAILTIPSSVKTLENCGWTLTKGKTAVVTGNTIYLNAGDKGHTLTIKRPNNQSFEIGSSVLVKVNVTRVGGRVNLHGGGSATVATPYCENGHWTGNGCYLNTTELAEDTIIFDNYTNGSSSYLYFYATTAGGSSSISSNGTVEVKRLAYRAPNETEYTEIITPVE